VLFALEDPAGKHETLARVLAEGLTDREPDVRITAAAILGRVGPPAKFALPALKTATEDKDPTLRKIAADAIAAINGE
jgi:HEAT repeat protein